MIALAASMACDAGTAHLNGAYELVPDSSESLNGGLGIVKLWPFTVTTSSVFSGVPRTSAAPGEIGPASTCCNAACTVFASGSGNSRSPVSPSSPPSPTCDPTPELPPAGACPAASSKCTVRPVLFAESLLPLCFSSHSSSLPGTYNAVHNEAAAQ